MDLSFLVVVVIITALVFDFTNGFHDTANAMPTSIATGALRPKIAVAISAVLNLVGAFISTEVAKTISSGLVDDTKITVPVIFGGGATWIAAGSSAVHFGTVVQKVIVPAVAAPIVAGVVALLARSWPTRSPSGPPVWVILSAGLAIAAGTYLGGWRIIRTMGEGLTEIESPQGFSAETSSTATLLISAHLGFPLSTTQVCSGNLGVVIIALLAIVAGGGIYLASRRRPVTSDNVNEYPATTAAAA
ncbi:inorganic phosphate transporter [Kribbella capetownensis]|uniref:Inorganic phosphate transporter n=1 Tax=Kribbella capetownensis TaxID=1572659 RepID=A0A4V6N4E1_9ACTN|nr:inorganic phosphate transporter [Kribbella capetownensis]